VSVYQIPAIDAIRLTGTMVKACSLYQCSPRLPDWLQKEEEVTAIDYDRRNGAIEDDGGEKQGR
jgi:hypothetical protein